LQDIGVRLGPADLVDPPINAAIVAGMGVTVKHAKAVTLLLGTEEHTIYTQRVQLKEALADIGLTLASDDRIEPGLDTVVSEGMTAKLVRVGGREFIEKETIAKKTEFKPDASLSGTAYRVVQGHDGVRTRIYRVVIEDGMEREKRLVKESFEREPQATVIYYPSGSAAPTGLPDGNINVTGVNRVYATWYNAASSGKSSSDPAYGVTRSGQTLKKGIVAVDPKVIPLGTRLYIPGYGFAVAGDTGGGIKGNMIDLGYPDGAPADWRTGWVDIYILGN
jgi:3D (Asp-Asp-Asp) domain-containing protein